MAGSVGVSPEVAGALGLDRASALMSMARASGTLATYASALRGIVHLIQRTAAEAGVTVLEADIFPPGAPTPVEYVLAYLGAAAYAFSTSTIEGALAAIKHRHVYDDGGPFPSPSDTLAVKACMDGIRNAHSGSMLANPAAAMAIRPAFLKMLVATADGLTEAALRAGDFRGAYGATRDALYYTLSFLACLRREEAVAISASHISPGVVPGSFLIWVPRSKTDKVGVSLPIAGRTDTGISLRERLARLRDVLRAWGKPAGSVLFGNMSAPEVALASSASMVKRLMETYVPEMAARGLSVPNEFRFSGHSFRRGGITAIRDAARAEGCSNDSLRTLLLKFGRWRDPRSLEKYLSEDMSALTALTQRL